VEHQVLKHIYQFPSNRVKRFFDIKFKEKSCFFDLLKFSLLVTYIQAVVVTASFLDKDVSSIRDELIHVWHKMSGHHL
jgi:hypothetical protein